MGILDFVKSGVREMMIARPEGVDDLIFKHPDRTIPMFAQCTVRADEWAVFAKEGRPAGTLDAGRHTLQANNIPFLSNLIDDYTGGNVLLCEVFFVQRIPKPMRFGGALGSMIDPSTQIRLRLRCHGEVLVRVENPEKMIYGYFGMKKFQEHPDVFSWFTDSFFMTVKEVLGTLAREQRRTLFDVMDLTSDIADMLVARSSDLAESGIRIVKVSKLEIDAPEEDMKRFDEMRQKVADQLVGLQADEVAVQRAAMQAQAETARAQVLVQKAAFDAQGKQFELDQKYGQDARYVQNLAGGNFQSYAAGQAAIGAGQGMAKGGGDAGTAGAMAQMGVGLGIANVMSQAASGQAVGAAGARVAPGMAAGAAVALLACGACRANVPPGKFCAECGAPIQTPARKCSGCNVELAPAAKFCAECGTPSVPR